MIADKNQNKLVVLIYLVALLCVATKCYTLTSINFDIDSISIKMTPMLKNIKQGSRIGFDSNLDSVAKYSVYYSSKFVTAPRILLLKKDLDTMLTVQSNHIKLLYLPDYKIIDRAGDKENTVLLLIKQK